MSETTATTTAALTLTLTPKSEMVVKPKPTKREIIDALVEIRLEQVRKQNLAAEERKRKLADRLHPALIKHVIKNAATEKPTVNLGYSSGGSGIEVEFRPRLSNMPEDLKKDFVEYHDVKFQTYGGRTKDARKAIRREIEDAMQSKQPAEERVQALLNDKDSRANLENILDQLTGKTIAVNAQK